MIKRFLLVIFILCLVFCNSVSANENKYLPVIPEDFYTIEDNADEIASLFNMTKDGVYSYCKQNNIYVLAVSKDGKKEIRLQIEETEFSKKVFDFDNYSDNELYTLSLDIIGLDGVTGKIVENNGQKFIKTEISTVGSSNNYSVLQYRTVANGKYYILSFYYDNGIENEFSNDVFKGFNHTDFKSVETKTTFEMYDYLIPIGIAVISIFIIATIIFVIKGFKKQKT